jgi:GNAT superfamily N-acetyltransferase
VEVSLEPVPDGELAAIVTYLEMTAPPPGLEVPDSPLSLRRLERPEPERYREIFRRVGERWLWFSRLINSDDELRAILHDPKVELYAVEGADGGDSGMLELDFRKSGQCELAFLGLVAELAGRGHGRWLLAEALRLAWREGVSRLEVHTCTLDHPAALPAYVRAGFRPYRRAVERFPDPRLLGVLPSGCAPQVPLLGTLTSAVS